MGYFVKCRFPGPPWGLEPVHLRGDTALKMTCGALNKPDLEKP